jgi:hypothetical protein
MKTIKKIFALVTLILICGVLNKVNAQHTIKSINFTNVDWQIEIFDVSNNSLGTWFSYASSTPTLMNLVICGSSGVPYKVVLTEITNGYCNNLQEYFAPFNYTTIPTGPAPCGTVNNSKSNSVQGSASGCLPSGGIEFLISFDQ